MKFLQKTQFEMRTFLLFFLASRVDATHFAAGSLQFRKERRGASDENDGLATGLRRLGQQSRLRRRESQPVERDDRQLALWIAPEPLHSPRGDSSD